MQIGRVWYELVIHGDSVKICHGDSLDGAIETFQMFQELNPQPVDAYELFEISEHNYSDGSLGIFKKPLNLKSIMKSVRD